MSNPDLVQYIVEQASKAGDVRARKMFGDYVSQLVRTVAQCIPEKRKRTK